MGRGADLPVARLGRRRRLPRALVRDSASPARCCVAVGGLLYTAGAVVYATQRPNPSPAIFGYHEVFHLFVIAAAVAHFSAIAFFALPHA